MNNLLTDVKITRKSLAILHNKSTFLGTIGRQYDDQFANAGGKIGSQLKIRLPNQYAFRRGPVANLQPTNENSITLVLANIGGTDMDFTDVDLTLSLDDFSERIIEPAVSNIVANIESDAFQMFKDVYQLTGTAGATPTGITPFLNAKTLLNQSLTPKGKGRKVQVDSVTSAAMVNGMTNFFNPNAEIAEQFLEGSMGRAANLDFYENELIPVHTTGTMTGYAGALVTAIGAGGTSITIGGMTAGATITQGTVFTLAGCNKIHPETKATYGQLQQFVATADAGATGSYTVAGDGTVTINISPAIIPATKTNGLYNAQATVDANPTLNSAGSVVFVGAASTSYGQNLAYDKSAFTFVTADLTMPKGMDMCYKEVSEGLSLRILRGFDIINNVYLSRLDILYGYLTTRPQCAVRITR